MLTLPVALLLTHSIFVVADDSNQSVDTSRWVCQYCQFEQGLSSNLEGSFGYISQGSYKFGEYNGLQEQGVFVTGNATSRYRNIKSANYWDINASDIGLDTRSLTLQGGKQGLYNISMSYKELPHYLSDTGRTPFLGSGGDKLSLPTGWVHSGSTAGMTALDSSLSAVDLATKRTQLGVGAMFIPEPKWETSIKFRHETREGKRPITGSFYFDSVELVQPVDYTSDLIDATASYTSKTWQAKLAYHVSLFKNHNDSLVWQNPYTPIVAGANQGQLSLPPDNQFHQLLASVAIRFSQASRGSADIAVGRMTQNENFLAATDNSNLMVTPLPADSLDGRVDTANANVKWITDFNEKLRMNATYQYSNRNNKTAQHTYDWIITDVNAANPRTNLPYSYRKNKLKLKAEYKLMRAIKTSLGYDFEQYKRTYQEVEKSREQSVWASIIARSRDDTDLTLKAAHSIRKKDGYQVIAGVDNPENPLLRKYNMADRDRDTLGLRMDMAATDQSAIGISLDLAKDDYPDSAIGLTSSKESSFGLDLSTPVAVHTTVNFFFSREKIASGVSGSQLYDIPDWSGAIDDYFNTAGLGFNHILVRNKLEVGADFVYTHSIGKITLIEGGSGSRLPDLVTRQHSIKTYVNYHLSEAMMLNGVYWYERYSSRDWALDGVNEDTIANNLSLGQESPAYHVNVVILSVRYKL
jgi:MtrB/PioB family decaheme-associated outer membrane protein